MFGVFLLRDSGPMAQVYEVLRVSPIAGCCGGGGMRVLMPFCFISGINSVFNALIIVQFPILCVYTVVTTLLAVLEGVCAVYAWKVYQAVAESFL